MATTPEQVRQGLQLVTSAAVADVQAVTRASVEEGSRAPIFAAAPLLIAAYTEGSAALALDWYEELRDLAEPRRPFVPAIVVPEHDLERAVAWATESMWEVEQGIREETEAILAEVDRRLSSITTQEVANGFRETVTENVAADPDAVGWRRHARPEACKFCKMLADRGAVYTESTARFAAHGAEMRGGRKGGDCMCIAGPAFGGKEVWAEATPIQYMASRRERSDKDRARLRDYLNTNYADAPG